MYGFSNIKFDSMTLKLMVNIIISKCDLLSIPLPRCKSSPHPRNYAINQAAWCCWFGSYILSCGMFKLMQTARHAEKADVLG